MRNDPVLASCILPRGSGGYNVSRKLIVEGGLHYMRGNKAPYFSLTSTAHRLGFPNQCCSGGADHNHILKHFPRFADLAALHLSDIDGVPMHAVGNGWYDLAGALGGAGQRYHVGNSARHFPCTPPADKPWRDTEYREPTQAECLDIFAKSWRITLDEAQLIAKEAQAAIDKCCIVVDDAATMKEAGIAILTARLPDMRKRWKAEADACIARHGLRVYGDQWPVTA